MKTKKILSRHYALSGNSVFRQLAHWFRLKISITGNFDTGPGLKNLVTLIIVHYFGRAIFWARIWLRNCQGLTTIIKKIIRRAP